MAVQKGGTGTANGATVNGSLDITGDSDQIVLDSDAAATTTLTDSATSSRTLTFPDKTGTLATLADITGTNPRVSFNTAFETSGRFNLTSGGSGGNTFGTAGLQLQTGATSGSFAKTRFGLDLNTPDTFSSGVDPEFMCYMSSEVLGVTGEVYFGIADTGLAVAGTGITTTADQFGFNFVAADLFATNANGTTETATDITNPGDVGTAADRYYAKYTVGTNITFHVNGSLLATHTTNLPTSNTNVDSGTFGVSNSSTTANTRVKIHTFNHTEEVT